MTTQQDNSANLAAQHPATDGHVPRVLVVDEALADRLNDGLLAHCLPGAQVQAVPAFLNAIGELTRNGATAVIVPVRAMTGMVAVGARTMRRMAPDARLLVVAAEVDRAQAERAIEHGFDALVPEPLSLPALQAAWHGRPSAPAADTDAESNGETPPAPAPDTAADAPADRADAPPDRATANDAPSPPTAGATSFSQRPAMPTTSGAPADTSAGADAELGDVDLIEAILNGRGLLRRTALRLLAARSGITDVDWLGPDQDPPAGHAVADVACRNHRFGALHAPASARQDHLDAWAGWLARWLTLERQVHQLEEMSMKDELTGVWNRRYFNRFLKHVIDRSARDRSQVTLLVFDIDDFKIYNDRYGHAAGDEILRETARLMQSSVREHDVVARIGGDEFAVIFWDADEKRRPDSHHPDSVRAAARRFQQAICQYRFPKLLNEAPGTLTVSGGLASFPWDGRTPEELTEKADQIAMQSKRQGKNAIAFGPGALRPDEP